MLKESKPDTATAKKTAACKICGSKNLNFFAHTARCKSCGVLLCYPYPPSDETFTPGFGRANESPEVSKEKKLKYQINSGGRNHDNLTQKVVHAMTPEERGKPLKILDFGGGSGQFALIAKSLYPLAEVYITDIDDHKMLDQYRPLNMQIRHKDFQCDQNKFDIIFMNDVFEHVSDPVGVLQALRRKLKDGGRISIDTPRAFWIYPFFKVVSKKIYQKILRGTVGFDHQQIWTTKSFALAVSRGGFKFTAYSEITEFTQPASFFFDNMGITNPLVRLGGKIFYILAPYIARNKVLALITEKQQ